MQLTYSLEFQLKLKKEYNHGKTRVKQKDVDNPKGTNSIYCCEMKGKCQQNSKIWDSGCKRYFKGHHDSDSDSSSDANTQEYLRQNNLQ